MGAARFGDEHFDAVSRGVDLLALESAVEQPPLLDLQPLTLTAAIASLALGGAERIVLDWAARTAKQHRVRLIVLRDATPEWLVPDGVEVVRLQGDASSEQLEALGTQARCAGNPIVLCHLLLAHERAALARGGAQCVPVLHNAGEGWLEPASALERGARTIAVSYAAAEALLKQRSDVTCSVVHHVPGTPLLTREARALWRTRWAIPDEALVIGMIGGVKPQKGYTRALRVLEAVLSSRDAYLVIVGGPTGRDGTVAWRATVAQAKRLHLESRVRLAGPVPHAARCLSAFDMLLNTSRYEGLSIATLEALAAGLPVVASDVGGQGELGAPGLTLLAFDADDQDWAEAIQAASGTRPQPPRWRNFPSDRLWTLLHIARGSEAKAGVLFVTANLNAGGAQRSLTNLAIALSGTMRMEIAVCGNSSSEAFADALRDSGVAVHRTADSRDCFDHAAAIVRHFAIEHFATVCFWNVDPKVKLLLAKVLPATGARLVDVSPGGYSFEEMNATRDFQDCIGFREHEYYAALSQLVVKYGGTARRGAAVISNGVHLPPEPARPMSGRVPRIVVSGRIAPSKFLLEIVEAMHLLWRTHSNAELHVLGCAEPRHAEYARRFADAIDRELGRRVVLHGASTGAPRRIADFDIALVLGEHQGSPNAVLEALAAGLPTVANDSGGTRELVIDRRTGILLSSRDPHEVAAALATLIESPALARALGRRGRRHVARRFSMDKMTRGHRSLFSKLERRR